MTCSRCAGLMVPESTYALTEHGCYRLTLTRCVCCGNLEDDVIRHNRALTIHMNRLELCKRGPRACPSRDAIVEVCA
jgi:hypothetical protein